MSREAFPPPSGMVFPPLLLRKQDEFWGFLIHSLPPTCQGSGTMVNLMDLDFLHHQEGREPTSLIHVCTDVRAHTRVHRIQHRTSSTQTAASMELPCLAIVPSGSACCSPGVTAPSLAVTMSIRI